MVLSSAGQTVWQAAYFPYGQADVQVATIEFNLRFPGQYYDAETGLHYNWHRYYDPQVGRYLTPDPIGLDGGINPYLYTLNNPLNLTDPNGLISLTGGGGFGGGFQIIGIGVHAHYSIECGTGGCYKVSTICGRFGPGMFLGGGTEVGGSIGPDADSKQDTCEEPCTTSWSVGVGGDLAVGNEGGGGGITGGPSGVSAGGGVKTPLSLGFGFSVGIDACYTKTCPIN